MFISSLLVTSVLGVHYQVYGASLPQRVPRQDPSSEPTCSGKDLGSTFTYSTTSGSAFDVVCGKDYNGGDFKSLQTASFKDCLAACDTETTCVTVAFRDGACYLKNQITPAVSNDGVWSAKKQKVPTSTALSCNNNLSDGVIYPTSQGHFKIICGKEYPGGDLTSTTASTFERCIAACAQNAQCIDVSYVDQACYLKSSLTVLTDVGYAWTAQLIDPRPVVVTPSPSPTGAAPLSCLNNADNGKSYTTKPQGSVFTIECGIDHAGGDMSSLDSTTFETCMDACAATNGCVDVSWVYGTCYLKSTVNEGVALSHVWTGRLVSAQASPVVSVTPSTTTVLAALSTATPSDTSSPTVVSSLLSSSTVSSATLSSTLSSSTLSSTTVSSALSSSTSSVGISSTSSVVVTTSSAILSASATTPTSSTVASSSTTTSAGPSVPTEFCLKVVTPGLGMSGSYVTNSSPNSNFVYGFNFPVLIFKLDQAGHLFTTAGNLVGPTVNSQPAVSPRQFTPATVAKMPSKYPQFVCSITPALTLECSATDGAFTYQYWSSQSNTYPNFLQSLSSPTYGPVNRVYYSLGLVAKELCPATN